MTCAAEDTPAAKRHDTVWLLFLIYLAYVIAFSLTPYAPTPELLGTRENATFEGLAGIGSSTNWDVITNVLLYVPFGALIVVFTRAWPRPPWVKTVGILAGALALSMLLEACQLFVRRFPSVSDVVWNSSGAVLGAIVGMLVIGPVGQTLHRRWRPTWTRPVLALLLAAYIAVLACAFSVTLPVSADFSNWEPSYRLQFGSDGRAAHPGRPALSLVAVYARALTSEDIALNFAATNNPDGSRTTKGLVAFYDFSPGADAGVQSADAPAGLAALRDRVPAELSIEVWLRPNVLPGGNAVPILAYSDGRHLANFLLAQRGHDVVFRLRTAVSGLAESRRTLRTFDGPLTAERHHVVVTYRDGIETLYLNGVERGRLSLQRDVAAIDALLGLVGVEFAWPLWSLLVFPLGCLTYLYMAQSTLVRPIVLTASVLAVLLCLLGIAVLRTLIVHVPVEPSFLPITAMTALMSIVMAGHLVRPLPQAL